MFCKCTSLEKIDIKNFKTDNVTDMNCMFSECSSLTELNFDNFNTKNVTNMSYMFYQCFKLEKLNLDNFKTSNVTNMSGMFRECLGLKEIKHFKFYPEKIKLNLKSMFYGCSEELINKIKEKYTFWNNEAFIDS